MTTVAAKTASLTADVRGHCNAAQEKWRECSYANEQQLGRQIRRDLHQL